METIPKQILKNVGRCIYCNNSGPYSEEHIIPKSLGGTYTLKNASCSSCSKITSQFELTVARYLMASNRAYCKLPTNKGHPEKFPINIKRFGFKKTIEIPIEEYGSVTFFTDFFIKNNGPFAFGTSMNREGGLDMDLLRKKYKTNLIEFICEYKPVDYARLIAKIAYCASVENFGIENIESSNLVTVILNPKDDIRRWVSNSVLELTGRGHQIKTTLLDKNIIAFVKMFAHLNGSPTYMINVGKHK